MSIWSKIWKGVLFVGGIVGVGAQAKARGASWAEVIAETAPVLVSGGAALQMKPLGAKKTPAP